MNVFKLTKDWFYFFRNNLDKVDSNHTAMYFYIIELFNQNDWIEVIGIPTDYTMISLNIKSYKTYKKVLSDLIEFGFVFLVDKSTNQHTSNKIALVKNAKATTKASQMRFKTDDISNDQSDCTIYKLDKLVNSKTIKLINDNAALVNSNLQKWIDSELSKPTVELSARHLIFQKWIDYRKQIKKPLKEVSLESLKTKWASKSDSELNAIIEQSISNGWQGLFELTENRKPQQNNQPQQQPFDPNRKMHAAEMRSLFMNQLNNEK